jgi:hypothetical protein
LWWEIKLPIWLSTFLLAITCVLGTQMGNATHFKHLSSKSFSMIWGILQSNEFRPLKSFSKNSGVHLDSNSQSGGPLGNVEIHSFTLSYIPRNMRCDSRVPSWLTPLQALALIVTPMLRLWHAQCSEL